MSEQQQQQQTPSPSQNHQQQQKQKEEMMSCVVALEAALLPCLPARELQAVDRSVHSSHQRNLGVAGRMAVAAKGGGCNPVSGSVAAGDHVAVEVLGTGEPDRVDKDAAEIIAVAEQSGTKSDEVDLLFNSIQVPDAESSVRNSAVMIVELD